MPRPTPPRVPPIPRRCSAGWPRSARGASWPGTRAAATARPAWRWPRTSVACTPAIPARRMKNRGQVALSKLHSDPCFDFAARVNRHARALPRRCRRVDARPAADYPPLCFMRRRDRASHRSGWSRGAAPFPNTHRSSRSPSRCASCVAQRRALERPPLDGSVRVRSCVQHGCRRTPFRASPR